MATSLSLSLLDAKSRQLARAAGTDFFFVLTEKRILGRGTFFFRVRVGNPKDVNRQREEKRVHATTTPAREGSGKSNPNEQFPVLLDGAE